MTPLTEHQTFMLHSMEPGTWHRPMDLGGANGTDHSAVLRQLCKKGYVEGRQRNAYTTNRGSKVYRITMSGRKAIA